MEEAFSSVFQPEIHPEVVLDVTPDLLKEEDITPQVDHEEAEEDEERSIDLASLRSTEKEENYVRDLFAKGGVRLFQYPEYNSIRNSYEKNYCTLFERVLDPVENNYYHEVLHTIRESTKK